MDLIHEYSSGDSDSDHSAAAAADDAVADLHLFSQNYEEMINHRKQVFCLLQWTPSHATVAKLKRASHRLFTQLPQLQHLQWRPTHESDQIWGYHISLTQNISFPPYRLPQFQARLRHALMDEVAIDPGLIGILPERAASAAKLAAMLGVDNLAKPSVNVPVLPQASYFYRPTTQTSFIALELSQQPVFCQLQKTIEATAKQFEGNVGVTTDDFCFHVTIQYGRGPTSAKWRRDVTAAIRDVDISDIIDDVVVDFDKLVVSTIGTRAADVIPLVAETKPVNPQPPSDTIATRAKSLNLPHHRRVKKGRVGKRQSK
ncbi:hypothetical protein DIURU_002710 [Diutina rugosa]|uniref:U6 snRNA phosphodiesterase n=1 Tax=Diutina rugosa TaxID=5481 RepID=A0A642UPM2_DIURU|nr:uncharacterized protein DIURU_002710 [Diutina rugosa]KAA8902814.1 hypothetical protein DIURU_002710 [Diutina rugosa]